MNAGLSRAEYLDSAARTIALEIQGLQTLQSVLDQGFTQACELILACKGRVVVTGMGKSGHVGRKIAATLASTGTAAFFMHPGEAGHGDLGMLVAGDVLLAISNSGESDEIATLLPVVEKLSIPLISISRSSQGRLPEAAAVALTLGQAEEACPLKLAPTTSTTATLALGDALAVALLEARNFTPEDFALSHPAGSLGKRLLLKVSDLMHTGDSIPLVTEDTLLEDALVAMTSKRLGMTVVLPSEGAAAASGIFTDGDLRRAFSRAEQIKTARMKDVMTQNPLSVESSVMAVDALELMRERSVNHLLVTTDGNLAGVVTLQDLMKSGLGV